MIFVCSLLCQLSFHGLVAAKATASAGSRPWVGSASGGLRWDSSMGIPGEAKELFTASSYIHSHCSPRSGTLQKPRVTQFKVLIVLEEVGTSETLRKLSYIFSDL